MANEEPKPTTTPDGATALRRAFHEIWGAAALAVIQQRSGNSTWACADEPHEPAAPLPTEVAAHWELSGALSGKLQIKLHRAAALAWARLGAGGAGSEAPAAGMNDVESASLSETLHQLADHVAAGLEAGGWGRVEVMLRHLGPLRRNVEGADGEFPLRFRRPDGEQLEFDLCLESELREQIRLGPRFQPGEAPAAGPESRPAPGAARLDLLLDVELDVTLRFGGRQMLLHDVLELAPGSVLELDRHIDDPVELLVGGKIIAWGEVVVVDGNYGLRITRLVHRRERMAAVSAA